MTSGERLTTYLDAVASALRQAGRFADVRIHLDLFDLDDVLKETFRTPAARIIWAGGKPEPGANGGVDLASSIVIAVICRREGRPDPQFTSADRSALTLSIDLISTINIDPYFGQPKVTPATPRGIKVAISEKNSKDGIAVVLVELGAVFLAAAEAYDPVRRALMSADQPTRIVVTAGDETIIEGAR